MRNESRKTFFLGLFKEGGNITGHIVSPDPAAFSQPHSLKEQSTPKTKASTDTKSDFSNVFRGFVTTMESYRKFIPLTLGLAPVLATSIADSLIGKFVQAKGQERPDLSGEKILVYELDISCYREFSILDERVISSLEGTKHLPEIMVMGLISSYDALLTRLLKVVLNRHGEIFFTTKKSITFAELLKFDTMDDAKANLIDKEVEAVIRNSHHEQFKWMEENFSMKLRSGLDVWPRFIELCERRNLLTHNGGLASKQYIANCKEHKFDVSSIKVGDKLPVDAEYFSGAVDIIYEIGVKLCYVLWRKFSKEEIGDADRAVNELCFDLIHGQAYNIAEAILRFTVIGFAGEHPQMVLSMMTINLANAIRLQGRHEEAKKLLNARDWSGSDVSLKMGVAAVKGEVNSLVKFMKQIGNNGRNAENYRSWPIFRGMRRTHEFVAAFEEIFGEPLIHTALTTLGVSSESVDPLAVDSTAPPPTKH